MNILIIEDDLEINKNIRTIFESEGYHTDCAFDGYIGEKLLAKNTYNCIIMDINLPHKNGLEICRAFRQYNTSTPILFLTVFDELDDKIQGFNSGADDYLTKPFYMKELLLRVNSLIKRSLQSNYRQEDDQKLVVADVVIDLKNKSIKKGDKDISLTPREFQILTKLAEAKGELVPKQELIKEIWGSVFDTNTNTVEVYINFLRNKIDKPFGCQMIKTKVGYGYYLDLKNE